MLIQKIHILIITGFFITVNTISTYAASYDLIDDKNVIWASGYNSFVFEKIDTTKYGVNDHPVELDREKIANALKSLEIWDTGFFSKSKEPEPLFAINTIQRIAEFVTKGLSEAKGNQDIYFVVQAQKSKLILLKQKFMHSGRAFYKEGKLNLIIGAYSVNLNDSLEDVLDPGDTGASITKLGMDKASRDRRFFKFDEDSIKITGIENKTIKGDLRKDWFVIDVDVASKAYLAKINEINNPKTEQDKQLEIEAAKLAKQRREMRAEMARMRKEVQDATSDKSSSAKSIEERMATLDQLLDKKLITQEEYDTKRKEILSDI